MVKISRPVIYTAMLGVVAYAVVLYTEPEAVKKKAKPRLTAAATLPGGFTAEDLSARFARYAGKARDAFSPKVISKQGASGIETALTLGAPGEVWRLTGITVVNGMRKVLVENPSTGESVFLKIGERWNGFLVAVIEPDAVLLVNSKGQPVRLTFIDPSLEKAVGIAPVVVPTPTAGVPTPITGGGPLILPPANNPPRNANQP